MKKVKSFSAFCASFSENTMLVIKKHGF